MLFELFKRGGFVAVILAVLAIVFALIAQNAGTAAQAMTDHGQSAIATVVDKEQETSRRRAGSDVNRRPTTTYYLTYAFETPEGSQQVEVSVPKALYEDTTVRDEAEIRYLPEEPTTIEAYPGQMASGAFGWGVTAGVLALASLIAAAVAWVLTSRARLRPQMA